jgi:hypothetical protein
MQEVLKGLRNLSARTVSVCFIISFLEIDKNLSRLLTNGRVPNID